MIKTLSIGWYDFEKSKYKNYSNFQWHFLKSTAHFERGKMYPESHFDIQYIKSKKFQMFKLKQQQK